MKHDLERFILGQQNIKGGVLKLVSHIIEVVSGAAVSDEGHKLGSGQQKVVTHNLPCNKITDCKR